MNFRILLIIITTLAWVPAEAQKAGPNVEHQVVPISLELSETRATAEIAPTIVLPVKCDLDGNIYVRTQEGVKIGGGPVLKIAPDAKSVVRIELAAVTDLPESRIVDFAPGPHGEVYLLTTTEKMPEQIYVSAFDRDGKYQSKSQLDESVRPAQIAVFGSGDLFLSGRESLGAIETGGVTTRGHELNRVPFLGIFDTKGKLLKRLETKKDVRAKTEYVKTPMGEALPRVDRNYERAVTLSFAEIADDGNVYLVRNTPTGPVFVFSPAGELKRTFGLLPPKGAYLSGVRVGKSRLVAKYIKNKPGSNQIEAVILRDFSLPNGKLRTEYTHSDFKIGSAFACVSGDEFVFLGTDDKGHLTLVRAHPK